MKWPHHNLARLAHTQCVIAAIAFATPAWAEVEVFLTIGEFGEVAFSDIPSEQAKVIHLPEHNQQSPSSSEQVELMLETANDLAQARRAREAQREELRRTVRNNQPVERYESDPYDYDYDQPIWFAPPNQPQHPPMTEPSEPAPQSRKFRFTPKI